MNQAERVKNYILDKGSITSMEAFRNLQITRLSARIADLREMGVDVITTWETSTNVFGETSRYARYLIRKGEN